MVYLLRKNIKIKRLSDKLNYKKLGLFKIRKVYRLVTFKLELLNTIKIYPIFYKSLLELYYNPDIMPGLIEIDEETGEP